MSIQLKCVCLLFLMNHFSPHIAENVFRDDTNTIEKQKNNEVRQ